MMSQMPLTANPESMLCSVLASQTPALHAAAKATQSAQGHLEAVLLRVCLGAYTKP